MKQLLYTSCEAGKSLDGAEGFQIRAASAGIGPERMRAAKPYMAYSLPSHVHPLQLASESSPVRLAFLKTPQLGVILCHSVAAGQDPSTHRPGNFFSHLVMDTPPALTARVAIKTWQSDSWQQVDGSFDATLPDVEAIQTSTALSDEALSRFLSSEQGQRIFRFVLAAILSTGPDWRIFVAAASQDVALCIYGLTRVLPERCQRSLTFSTYESQPLSCPARVVGTWAGDSADTDMPSSCYSGRAVGYNSWTGRVSQLTLHGDFAEHATKAAMTGDRQGLDDLLTVCEQCGVDRLDLLDPVWRAEIGGQLTADDVRHLLPCPRFLSHLLEQTDTRRPLLDRLAEDPELAATAAAHVVPVLKENSEALAATRESAAQAAIEATLHGKPMQTRVLLGTILPAVSDTPAASAAVAVMKAIADPCAVPWQTRSYLLTQLTRVPSNAQESAVLVRWLSPSQTELPLLCGLPLPNDWKAHACLTCLMHAGVSSAVVNTLLNDRELLLEVLRRLPGNVGALRHLSSLIAELLAASTAPAGLVGDLVSRRSGLSPEVTSAFLAAAARNGTIDVFSLASRCGPSLLEMLDGGNGLDAFLANLLDLPSEKLLSDRQILELCRAAMRTQAPDEIRRKLDSVLVVRSFLDRPFLNHERVAQVAIALNTFRCAAITESVLQAALASILAEEDSPHVGSLLESLLAELGSVYGGVGGLYGWLLQEFRSRKVFWKRPYLICVMVATGLGATDSADATRHVATTARPARDLAEEVAKRSPRRVFTFIDQQSRAWPDRARLHWELFAKFVRPRGLVARIAGSWKRAVAVLMVLLCLIIGASRVNCRGSAAGTGVAIENPSATQPPISQVGIAQGTDHDRPQP